MKITTNEKTYKLITTGKFNKELFAIFKEELTKPTFLFPTREFTYTVPTHLINCELTKEKANSEHINLSGHIIRFPAPNDDHRAMYAINFEREIIIYLGDTKKLSNDKSHTRRGKSKLATDRLTNFFKINSNIKWFIESTKTNPTKEEEHKEQIPSKKNDAKLIQQKIGRTASYTEIISDPNFSQELDEFYKKEIQLEEKAAEEKENKNIELTKQIIISFFTIEDFSNEHIQELSRTLNTSNLIPEAIRTTLKTKHLSLPIEKTCEIAKNLSDDHAVILLDEETIKEWDEKISTIFKKNEPLQRQEKKVESILDLIKHKPELKRTSRIKTLITKIDNKQSNLIKLQSFIRSILTRNKIKKQKQKATKIQLFVRSILTRNKNARTIQTFLRSILANNKQAQNKKNEINKAFHTLMSKNFLTTPKKREMAKSILGSIEKLHKELHDLVKSKHINLENKKNNDLKLFLRKDFEEVLTILQKIIKENPQKLDNYKKDMLIELKEQIKFLKEKINNNCINWLVEMKQEIETTLLIYHDVESKNTKQKMEKSNQKKLLDSYYMKTSPSKIKTKTITNSEESQNYTKKVLAKELLKSKIALKKAQRKGTNNKQDIASLVEEQVQKAFKSSWEEIQKTLVDENTEFSEEIQEEMASSTFSFKMFN